MSATMAWNRAQSNGWCWRTSLGGHWSFWERWEIGTWARAGYPEIPLSVAWDVLEFL